MCKRSVLEGRIDLPGAHLIPPSNEDPTVPAELRVFLAGQVEDLAAQDRFPEPQAALPAVAGQQRSGRVKGDAQRQWQPSRIARGRPSRRSRARFWSRSGYRQGRAVGTPRDGCGAGKCDRTEVPGPCPHPGCGKWRTGRCRRSRSASHRVDMPGPGLAPVRASLAGLAGLQVVDQERAVVMAKAIRRLSGLNRAAQPLTGPGSRTQRALRSTSQTATAPLG